MQCRIGTEYLGPLRNMDFLGVCDSGDWGDSSDAKNLHAKLFSPIPKSKKSKIARKKHASVIEKQSDTRKLGKNQTSQKLQHGSDTDDTLVRTKKKKKKLAASESEIPVNNVAGIASVHRKTAKKNKRKLDASDASGVPVKKAKALLATATLISDGESNKKLRNQQDDKNETLDEDRTILNPNPKKNRKRKPRNNKFKTAEFGYVANSNEAGIPDAGSKSPEQSRKSIARSAESAGDIEDGNKKVGRKRLRKTKAKNVAKTESRTAPSKNNVDRTEDKSDGARTVMSSPGDKLRKTASENVNQKRKMADDRTKRNKNMKKDHAKIDPGLFKKEIEPSDREHAPTKREEADGNVLKNLQDEDVSEEPLPDLLAKHALKSKMEAQLRSAHFRFLNEQLYKTTGSEAQKMMARDRETFDIYHQGFAHQVSQWPVNPVDNFIQDLKSRPAKLTVGDFGCGEARIAQSVNQTVHSFDLCALNEHVTVCDIEKVPLKINSLDVAIFCLSLMGTNWISYIKEANRVLKMKGQLKIAEVASRFASVPKFLKVMKQLGFKKENKDFSNKMFLMFDFTKEASPRKEVEQGQVLKPCLYKRR